jgi:hypothetical protein
MTDFETFECSNCTDSFKALPESNAASKELCSPSCESDHRAS